MRAVILAMIVATSLVCGGLVYAKSTSNTPEQGEGFVCPLTGEELPCEKCCPLCR